MTERHKTWIERCKEARSMEGEYRRLKFLVGEFWSFLEAADTNANFRAELPGFAAEIKRIFERQQLAEFLEHACRTKPLDASEFESDEELTPAEVEKCEREDIVQVLLNVQLVERTKEWLLR